MATATFQQLIVGAHVQMQNLFYGMSDAILSFDVECMGLLVITMLLIN